MPSLYENISGVELFVQDGNLYSRPVRAPGDTVLIIGPAIDGPNDKALDLMNMADVEAVYGPIVFSNDYRGPNAQNSGFSGNHLIKSLREAQAGGARNIKLMRVGGVTASGSFNMPANLNVGASGTILVYARYAGRLYNSTNVSVSFTSGATGGSVTVTQPAVKGGNFTISWSGATSGLTVLDVIDRVNSDVRNRTVYLVAGTIAKTAAARILHGGATLANGTDGTEWDDLGSSAGKKRLYDKLTETDIGTFALLDDEIMDIVVLAGLYADDAVDGNGGGTTPTLSVITAFDQFLARRSLDHSMIGVIGTRPLSNNFNDYTKIVEHYNALVNTTAGVRETGWLNAGYFMNAGFNYTNNNLEQSIDAGAYLSVVAVDGLWLDPNLGSYIESCAAAYAGLISSLPPQESTTLKTVKGPSALAYKFKRAYVDTLTGGIGRDKNAGVYGGAAYVTALLEPGVGYLYNQDVTAANRRSDFKNLQTVRIVQAVQNNVKSIVFPYLGRPNNEPIRQSLLTDVKNYLDSLYSQGALLGKEGAGYFVEMDARGNSPFERTLGILSLDITLVPAFQIKKIRINVKVTHGS